MWILTQDEQSLVNVVEIQIQNDSLVGWTANSEAKWILGGYESKERVNEVLQKEIVNFNIKYPNGIFKMPF